MDQRAIFYTLPNIFPFFLSLTSILLIYLFIFVDDRWTDKFDVYSLNLLRDETNRTFNVFKVFLAR